MISESMLREAALQSGEVYVQFFESTCDAEEPHVFSAQFDQKIEKLHRKANLSALRTFVRHGGDSACHADFGQRLADA